MEKQIKKNGFTLVEIATGMVVLTLMVALAAPSFIRSWMNANEAAAQSTLRVLHEVMADYRFSNFRYPADLAELGADGPGGPAYLDEKSAGGSRGGYSFQIVSSDADTYQITAIPQSAGEAGSRSFLITERGEIMELIHGMPTTFPQGTRPPED